ncbi:bifunctional enoyl-CoA hydratase/phosphate acetyltransferase [Rhodobium gokarnense]|uniref:Phosphate acetyltransferase n=1 Tax=Rhodobium gokarnense TaxID=364296 RepID=A0ABT3HHU4_9HYPH|nr:bifunctional enoyl-CoA hydratase/phosphate acetyltransferase [Rhodobium gokarnense]MCW2309914.1 phosphate acetyltransferase [Rhodobium gokarnense]
MLSRQAVTCPPSLLELAEPLPATPTAIVNAGAQLAMLSAHDATRLNLIEPVFFGDPDAITHHALELDWDISGYRIVATDNEADAAKEAAAWGGRGDVGMVMKGHIHTDVFMRAMVSKASGMRTGARYTHVFHMTAPDREGSLLISDGAVNVHPDFETRKSILKNAVLMSRALGNQRPHVAILSATEEATETIPSSIEAQRLSDWASENVADAEVFGPLAFDLAVSPDAGRIKGVDHPVAGNADILIVPDIVSGNALFKMMVYFMGACAAGLVLGAKVPILLTSRADPPAARLASAALGSVVNAHMKQQDGA